MKQNTPASAYHLRAMGFKNQQDWELISADDVEFSIDGLKGRPDFVFQHRFRDLMFLAVDYKSHIRPKQGSSYYELLQVKIYIHLVSCDIEQFIEETPLVDGMLVYADGERVPVSLSATERGLLQHHLAVISQLGRPTTVTQLAREITEQLTGERFRHSASHADAGIRAHRDILAIPDLLH